MRRIPRALIRLYPANWRDRYGDEFEALLEDGPPNVFGLFDLLKGALKMQLNVPAFPKLAVVLSIVGLLGGRRFVSRVAALYFNSRNDLRRIAERLGPQSQPAVR
jgi:hypothetical protein